MNKWLKNAPKFTWYCYGKAVHRQEENNAVRLEPGIWTCRVKKIDRKKNLWCYHTMPLRVEMGEYKLSEDLKKIIPA